MLVEVNQNEVNTSSVTKDVAGNLGFQILDWEDAHPLSNYCLADSCGKIFDKDSKDSLADVRMGVMRAPNST